MLMRFLSKHWEVDTAEINCETSSIINTSKGLLLTETGPRTIIVYRFFQDECNFTIGS